MRTTYTAAALLVSVILAVGVSAKLPSKDEISVKIPSKDDISVKIPSKDDISVKIPSKEEISSKLDNKIPDPLDVAASMMDNLPDISLNKNIAEAVAKDLVNDLLDEIIYDASQSKEALRKTALEMLFKSLKRAFQNSKSCWKDAYGRGVGKPISACAQGLQQDAGLCYPYCQSGYYGVGPVCWQDCPAGFRNDGAHCGKPDSYGRGAGWTSQGKCESQEHKACEKNGLLWYPKCADNFHAVGCCVCSPSCPNGMTDIGVSCQKKSYGRGVGKPLTCRSDQQYDAGLCYPWCKSGFYGVGPVCWSSCTATQNDCGALCLDESKSCSDKIKGQISSVVELAVAAAIATLEPGASLRPVIEKAIKTISDYGYPICE